MAIDFDPAKDAANLRKHGVPLSAADGIDFFGALVERSDRLHDQEPRYQALVGWRGEIWSFTFVERDEQVRAISLRRAKRKERQRYAERG